MSELFFRLEVIGRNHIPRSGPLIIASNHVSYLDPIFVGISSPRRLHYMAKEEIFRHPLFSWFLRKLQTFPVSRRRLDPSTIKGTFQLLEKGKILLIFPEGTRGDGKELQRARPGIGIIAERAGVPVVPVYIEGPERVLPRGSHWFHLHPVKVCFGPPLSPPPSSPLSEGEKRRTRDAFGDMVMAEIGRMKSLLEANSKICSPRESSVGIEV